MTSRWIAAGAAAAFAGACAFALASASPSPPQREGQAFTVAPAEAQVACPGALRLPLGDLTSAGDFAAGTEDRTLVIVGDGQSAPVGVGTAFDGVAATSVEEVAEGDLAGIAAMACLPAATDQWLVGGATTLGSSARLVLTNPGAAPTAVTVTLYGPLGVVEGAVVVPVAAHGQQERLLEGTAAELRTLAVHVESTGTGVVAALQDSRLEGFQPAGTDWISATQPSTRLVIPSLGSEVEGATATVRLMAPDGAIASLTLVTDGGVEGWSGARALRLEPGVVTDVRVPLQQFGALEITADAPVLAAARTVIPRLPTEGNEGDLAHDHEWVSGIDESVSGTLAAVVPREGATVAVYSPLDTMVTFVDGSGATIASAAVTGRTVVRLPIEAGQGTLVSTTGRLAWVLELRGDPGFLSAVQPADPSRPERAATVVSVPYEPVFPLAE